MTISKPHLRLGEDCFLCCFKNLKKKKSPSSGYSNRNGGVWFWNKREIMAIQLHSYTTKTTTFQPNLQSLLQISFRYLQSNYFYLHSNVSIWERERERERGCCAVERIKVVGFDGDRLWWQWLLWVDATKVNIKFYSLGFYWCDGLVQTNQRRISAKAFVRRWLPNPSNKEHLII